MDINLSDSKQEHIIPSGTESKYIKTFENKLYAILKPYSAYIALSYYPKLHRFNWSLLVQVSKSDTNHKVYYSVEPKCKPPHERIGPALETSRWRIKHVVNDRYPLEVDDYPLERSSSPLIVGLVRVAALNSSDSNGRYVDDIVRIDDHDYCEAFNKLESKSGCVYVSRVCQRLKMAGIMSFDTWDEVEQEVFAFGEKYKAGCTVKNGQHTLLPTMDSEVCGLDQDMELD